jgi:hypothetical protein
MSSTSETAHVREARRLCRQFTLDLYLRRGPFWEAVKDSRFQIQRRQHVSQVSAWQRDGGFCGELECSGCIRCAPSPFTEDAPLAIPPSLMDPEHPWRTPTQILINREAGQAIRGGVERLYYRWENEFHHAPSVFRQVFFAGCLMYDPPPDKLLEYADHANEWWQPRRRLSRSLTIPLQRETPPGLPIEWIPFQPDLEIAVQSIERESWESYIEVFKEILAAALSDTGVDAGSIIAKAEEEAHIQHLQVTTKTIVEQARQTDPSQLTHKQFLDYIIANTTPYIRVDDITSDDDVRKAFSYLRSLSPDDRRPQKSKRDPLTTVQCAIWYDDDGWSHERIANHFGWKVQYPAAQKPRCETARKHIAEGRQILKHKSPAP